MAARSRGHGRTPGEALRKAFTGLHGVVRTRSRPPAQSTPAKLRELLRTERGYGFMTAEDIHVQQRTLVGWLTGDVEPNAVNRGKIDRAYDDWLHSHTRQIPEWARDTIYEISGLVTTERGYPRHRGKNGNSPLRIDGSAASKVQWDEVERAYQDLEPDADIWDLFLFNVILSDLDFSYLEFPGDDYTIEIV